MKFLWKSQKQTNTDRPTTASAEHSEHIGFQASAEGYTLAITTDH